MGDKAGFAGNTKRAILTSSTTGTAIVAAPGAGLKIRVLAVAAVAAGAVSMSLASAANAITSTKALAANGGFILPYSEPGWYECAENEALNLTLGSAVSVGIDVTYKIVTV